MIATIVPQVAQAAQRSLATANAVKSLMMSATLNTGFPPDLIAMAAKDIGGFEFDYIGEQTIDAGADISDHYAEDGKSVNDHIALKPIVYTCRGFVSDVKQNKLAALGILGSIQSVLAPTQPYMTQYSPGTAAKMGEVLDVASTIEDQMSQIMALNGALKKIATPFLPTAAQEAYKTLVGLRDAQWPVIIVTPFKVLGKWPEIGFGITNVRLVSPADSRTVTDIFVTLKEMRVARSLFITGTVNQGTQS